MAQAVTLHSTWRDEKSVVRWRTEGEHDVSRRRAGSRSSGTIICASTHRTVAEHDVYASIYNPGKLALLVAWKDPSRRHLVAKEI